MLLLLDPICHCSCKNFISLPFESRKVIQDVAKVGIFCGSLIVSLITTFFCLIFKDVLVYFVAEPISETAQTDVHIITQG